MSFCRMTALVANLEASDLMMNGFIESGIRSTGAFWNYSFNFSNASWQVSVQFQTKSFFVKSFSGRMMSA